MTKPIHGLTKDIASRWGRALALMILTAAILLMLFLDTGWWGDIVGVLSIATIIGIIATDSGRGLHHSKAALYTSIISLAIWVVVLVDTLIHPPHTLFTLTAPEGEMGFSIEIAPIVLITGLLLLLALSGWIAYRYGQKRKDIRGTKKEKLFK